MRTVVAKFGGTSLADADQFRKVRDIVRADPARRFIVASAPGKRSPEDVKVTDLLLACYEKAAAGADYSAELDAVGARFRSIARALSLDFPLDDELQALRAHLDGEPRRDYVVSRGEYLNSRLLAAWLGFTFVDPEWCVCFDDAGHLDNAMTRRTLGAALRPLQNAVIAGFTARTWPGRCTR